MGLLCLTEGIGLGHTVQSYVDEATITFTACRDLMPDPEFYALCIQESFEELRDIALQAGNEPDQPAEPPRKSTPKGTSSAKKRSATSKSKAKGRQTA